MCSSFKTARTKSLICSSKIQKQAKEERVKDKTWSIDEINIEGRRRDEKKRSTQGHKSEFLMCDRTGSRFSGLVMRLSTNLSLSLVSWIYNSSLHVSTTADFPFETFSIGIWCVFPIALRTSSSSERKYLWTRAKLRMMLSLRNFFVFCLFVFLRFHFSIDFEWRRSGNVDAQSIKHSL